MKKKYIVPETITYTATLSCFMQAATGRVKRESIIKEEEESLSSKRRGAISDDDVFVGIW